MRQRFSLSGYIIMGLIAIGLIVSLRALIIPICVFALIFVLYKFPPSKWPRFGASKDKSKRPKRKNATFRVIQGNKGNDDDTPKYH
jgi:hypothetical protein